MKNDIGAGESEKEQGEENLRYWWVQWGNQLNILSDSSSSHEVFKALVTKFNPNMSVHGCLLKLKLQ